MVTPRYVKEGKLLQKGVMKFIRYKRDLISGEKMEQIERAYAEFSTALEAREEQKAERLAQDLTRVCEQSVPDHRGSALRENIEVIFVAVVIAVGIRAYFLQPFKIPTGSMQPTLNGVIGYPAEPGDEVPGKIGKAWEYLKLGRNYVDVVAEEDDRVVRIYERTRFKFFTFTKVECESGRVYNIYAPLEKGMMDLGMFRVFGQLDRGGHPFNRQIFKGQVLARGYVDTGDQVLVDKMSYHFRRPRRGEVFVFTTHGISGITGVPAAFGSQHYIKRLVGLPGDKMDVKPPFLFVNGQKAEEPGMRRVMSRENGYNGYTRGAAFDRYQLKEEEYFAMGDNSGSSSDSRMWGPVPEANLVGRALVVYWPFSSHWGKIR